MSKQTIELALALTADATALPPTPWAATCAAVHAELAALVELARRRFNPATEGTADDYRDALDLRQRLRDLRS